MSGPRSVVVVRSWRRCSIGAVRRCRWGGRPLTRAAAQAVHGHLQCRALERIIGLITLSPILLSTCSSTIYEYVVGPWSNFPNFVQGTRGLNTGLMTVRAPDVSADKGGAQRIKRRIHHDQVPKLPRFDQQGIAVLNGGCSSTSTKAVKRAMLSRDVILKIFDSEATQGRESSSFRCAAQKATQAGVPQL